VEEPGPRCTHPWLRVTCGVCGEAVDALGESPIEPALDIGGPPAASAGRSTGLDHPQATFIVARGHPELIDELRALMGHRGGVQIIEDRRQRPREEPSEEAAREFRKRLREEGQPESD
jgi:hypothetical protein